MNTRSLAVAALAAALLGVGSMVHTDQPPATHVQIVQAAGNRMSTAQVAESADHVLVADVVRLLGTDTGSGLPGRASRWPCWATCSAACPAPSR